jgi:hypothetical protein
VLTNASVSSSPRRPWNHRVPVPHEYPGGALKTLCFDRSTYQVLGACPRSPFDSRTDQNYRVSPLQEA